jgi:hypothetical protein
MENYSKINVDEVAEEIVDLEEEIEYIEIMEEME